MTGSGQPPAAIDWGVGRYETTAAQLAPAAAVVVQRASLRPGERVLDLGVADYPGGEPLALEALPVACQRDVLA